MRWLLAAFVALCALPSTGCGSGEHEEWPGPARASGGSSLDVASFNDFLAANEQYARSPVSAATELLRLDLTTAATTSINAHATGEGSSPVRVDVTLDRLGDDSVRAERYVLVLELAGEDGWRLASAVRTQRCWPGRGHETFSAERCL